MIKTTGETHWRRSKRCASGSCVEVARVGELFLMRDSKNLDVTPLAFDRDTWQDFITGVKSDEFGHG
jgi:predicted secreted Zn-dependent protease